MDWAATMLESFKAGDVRLVTYVPDKVLVPLIAGAQADGHFTACAATREEEAVGIAAGAVLGGMRGAILMQSSGFGNSVNALSSLVVLYQLPVVFVISERGTLGEFNPVQVPITRAIRPVLDALGVPHLTLRRDDELRFQVERALSQAFRTQCPVALLLSPILTGGKSDLMDGAMVSFPTALPERPTARLLNRLDLTRRLVATLTGDEAVIGGIGNTKFDLVAAGPGAHDFPMLGSMGLAVSIGLGVALAQPQRRVIALEGDGSILMNLGCLATVAQVAPPNLTIVIWDNGSYQITGNQRTATATGADIVGLARGAGIRRAAWAIDEGEFAALVTLALGEPGLALIGARVDDSPGQGRPEWDPVILKDRFMRGIGAKG